MTNCSTQRGAGIDRMGASGTGGAAAQTRGALCVGSATQLIVRLFSISRFFYIQNLQLSDLFLDFLS